MSKNHSFSGYESIRSLLAEKGAKIRFIGIGGVGMYSLAMLCANLGFSVSGSDREGGALADKLIGAGISVQIGNSPREIDGTDLVVYSLAISEEDGELSRAAELNIPAVSRAELLGALMRNYLTRISVSGTHGKSTVTAMLDAIFELDGKRPTTLAGASLPGLDSPLRIGSEEWFICEACEYKDSFLMLSPTLSVFTNLEFDHPDYFLNFDMLKDSFSSAMDLSGICVVNADDPVLCEIARDKRCEIVMVGEGENAEYRIANIESRRGKYFFEISHALTPSVKIGLKIQGRFNIANAALAAVTALRMGVCSEII